MRYEVREQNFIKINALVLKRASLAQDRLGRKMKSKLLKPDTMFMTRKMALITVALANQKKMHKKRADKWEAMYKRHFI